METVKLELNDIQGLIRRGYGKLPFAYFLLLKITNPHNAKVWLGKLAGEIRDGTTKPIEKENCVNIAFTQAGFEELGLVEEFFEDERFSIEFEDGMTTEHRKQILGDYESSDPDKWDWGGPKNNPVHILLLLHAGSQNALDKLRDDQREKFEGLEEICKENGEPFLDALELPDRKEHFGFRDGISQPRIAGLLDKEEKHVKNRSQKILQKGGSDGNIIAAGEFILGYRNVYEKYPASPKVKAGCAPEKPEERLKSVGDGVLDFGRNGSYLVFRQLHQNVYKFWQHIDSVAKSDPTARDKLAAKMVGRWRSGAPIVLRPDKDDPLLRNEDKFDYYEKDRYGYKCPVAAHVRRANPRDSKDADEAEPEVALRDANKHRIIRRGRPYGKPIAESMDPKDILAAGDKERKVGLQFLCFNANIGRQFEFVQHSWINNSKFNGLYSSADPLLGPIRDDEDKKATTTHKKIFGNFVEPAEPLRRRVSDMQRYVDVVGGAYFFMPGINAIRYLANLP